MPFSLWPLEGRCVLWIQPSGSAPKAPWAPRLDKIQNKGLGRDASNSEITPWVPDVARHQARSGGSLGTGGGGEGGGDKSRPPVLGCPAERTPELMALSLSAL